MTGLNCLAHPAWALVSDREGNIYVSDLLTSRGKVIRFSVDGGSEVILTDIHSHDLHIDRQGWLWGTNTRYFENGEYLTNSLWKWKDGELEWLISDLRDFTQLNGSNFVLDESGGIYYNYDHQIYYRNEKHVISRVSDFQFGRICTLAKDLNGNLLISDSDGNGCLYSMDRKGNIKLLADGLLEENPIDPPLKERRFNMFFGIHTTDTGIYLTNSGSRRIWLINESNKSSFYQSKPPYYPINILIHGPDIFILEASFDQTGNGTRLIRLNPNLKLQEVVLEWHA
jgi:hypothetical protein